MRHRTLGRTGFQVSELGYGAWGIGGAGWIGAEDSASLEALREAIAAGVNFIDTALVYGDGHSERLVGAAVRAAPDAVLVATKIPPADREWEPRRGQPVGDKFSAAWVVEATERSLRNLGLETIDLQQFHTWSDDWVDQGDWAEGVAQLKESGKIRAFGVSIRPNAPGTVLRAIESGVVDAVQLVYNIFEQSPEDELLPSAERHGVGIVVRVPFDEGGLTGRLRADTTFPDGDFRNSYFAGDRLAETVERARGIVDDLGLDEGELPTVALRFCLAHPAVSTVIPGMRSVENVRRNVAAVGAGPLPDDRVSALRPHRWDRS